MWPLNFPTLVVATLLETCVLELENVDLREAYLNSKEFLEAQEFEFIDAAFQNKICSLVPDIDPLGSVSAADMLWLYKQRFVAKGSPGRKIYDQIKTSAPYGRCPLCGHGTVYSLDHHLPKSRFADFSITPLNLIPACQDCNKNKTSRLATTASEETLHPYFDDIDNECWLRGRMIETTPPAVLFYISPPDHWDPIMTSRVEKHFEVFKLSKLYASLAANELVNIKAHLRNVPDKKEHLADIAKSRSKIRKNSWQIATYVAMSESQWFCEIGYSLI